jgi:hypothetical protein
MSDFTESIARNLEGCEAFSVGGSPTCKKCFPDGYQEDDEVESSFSWQACDSCGSTFGGDRSPAHWLDGKALQHCAVCVDCLAYHANGDLPETWQSGPTTGYLHPSARGRRTHHDDV